MWDNPDVRNHVKEYTDFKLSNMIDFYAVDKDGEAVNDYQYVHIGNDFNRLIFPDVSANNLINKLQEILNKSDQYTNFTSQEDYKAPIWSKITYDNPALFPIILYLNGLYSNADFTAQNLKTLTILNKDDLRDLILESKKQKYNTVKEVTKVEEYAEAQQEIIEKTVDYDESVSSWLNVKIPNFNFDDIKNNPLYKKLINEFGEEYVNKMIIKLTKYKKKHSK